MINSNSTFVNPTPPKGEGDNQAIGGDISEKAKAAYLTSCEQWGLEANGQCNVDTLHGLLNHIEVKLRNGNVEHCLTRQAVLIELAGELPPREAQALHRRLTDVLYRLEHAAREEALQERSSMAKPTSFESNMALLNGFVGRFRVSQDAKGVSDFFHAVGRAQNLSGDEDGSKFAQVLHAAAEAVQFLPEADRRGAASFILSMARRVPDGFATVQELTPRLASYR